MTPKINANTELLEQTIIAFQYNEKHQNKQLNCLKLKTNKYQIRMTREQERDELHRTIWQIANDLRGSVDGWDFKSYVLGILFYRFISENLTSHTNIS